MEIQQVYNKVQTTGFTQEEEAQIRFCQKAKRACIILRIKQKKKKLDSWKQD